jgi:hypothetical protein
LQRAVVGAGLKAGRVGLHGSSTQAGRKWPCAKREVAVVKQEKGGWAVGGGGEEPIER